MSWAYIKTIDKIIKEAWYTKQFLLECRCSGRTNWMGWKWWIQWTDEARKLKGFESSEEQELLNDLDLVSDIHDLDFEAGWWIIAYIKANYKLIMRILELLHWTSTFWRITIFCLAFFWLNIFWIKYFNFTKLI